MPSTATQLEPRIATADAEPAPSRLQLEGCGALTAARILAEAAGVSRFRSRSASTP